MNAFGPGPALPSFPVLPGRVTSQKPKIVFSDLLPGDSSLALGHLTSTPETSVMAALPTPIGELRLNARLNGVTRFIQEGNGFTAATTVTVTDENPIVADR